MFGWWPIASAPVSGEESFPVVGGPGVDNCARQIAVQGVGYSPRLVAIQGFCTGTEVEPVTPEYKGIYSGWAAWFPKDVIRPETRVFRVPSVTHRRHVPEFTARAYLRGAMPSLGHKWVIDAGTGRAYMVRASYSVTRGQYINKVVGRNNTTRIEEEAVAMILLVEDDD